MKTQQIRQKVLTKNNWINGRIDAKDGDVSAPMRALRTYDQAIENKKLDDLFKNLKDGLNGLFVHKNLIFANHFNYGCFVYKIVDNDIKQVEHLTMTKSFKCDEFKQLINNQRR